MQWLKHAFAIESETPGEPNEAQRRIIDRICAAVVARGMTTPAMLYLEMSRPLNYLASQTLHFFQPIVAAVLDTASWEEFARFLERRGSVDYLLDRLEHFEREARRMRQSPAVRSLAGSPDAATPHGGNDQTRSSPQQRDESQPEDGGITGA